MKATWLAGAALLGLAHVATTAAATAQTGGAPTVQQQFEAGSDALTAGKWDEALAAFIALEQRLSGGKNARSLAIVRVRKGEALARLGRDEEAEAALKAGIPGLPAGDMSIAEDRFLAALAIGQIEERALDYGGAADHYRIAESAATTPFAKIQAIGGIVRTTMFQDAASALADTDRAIALLPEIEGSEKSLKPSLQTLRGRVLMNLGRFKDARKELRAAVDDLGGLTLQVDVSDLSARGDLALASLLDGDEESARKYFAYTGAGRTKKPFARGAEVAAPSCEETGLSPEDVAVVQFAIADDGSVVQAVPIYASTQGPSALEFARAASKWSWAPDAVKDIPGLLRRATRVEMRCSTAVERPSLRSLMRQDVEQWLVERGSKALDGGTNRQAVQLAGDWRAELARREAADGAASLSLFPLLLALAENSTVAHDDRRAFFERATAIARAEQAPGPVLAYLAIENKLADDEAGVTRRGWKRDSLLPLLDMPSVASSPRAAAAVRLMEADSLASSKKRKEARAILATVRDDGALPATDSLRTGALVRLASLEIAEGNEEAARAAFAASGLDAQQCALVDAGPIMVGGRPTSAAFPNDALRWGFEGWTVTEFDITADGDSRNLRTTVAYPPFVFSAAGRTMFDRIRYQQTYRPDGGLGCGAQSSSVTFRLPD